MRDRVSVGKLSGTSFDRHSWLSYLTFDAVDRLDDALIRVQSPQPRGTLQVQVLQVSRERRSPDKLRPNWSTAGWRGLPAAMPATKQPRSSRTLSKSKSCRQIYKANGGAGVACKLALREPGCYLLTAVTKKGSPIGISLSERSAGPASKLATRSWLACPIEAEAPRKLTATILGAEPDEYEAVLYRASR